MGAKRKVDFYRHCLGEEELASFQKTLGSLFHTTGPVCAEFEERFADYLGVERVVTVASCTAGLELCLMALDIGPGDEVITTPLTFMATANACLQVGARPVFVDVEPATGLIDPELVEEAITPRTRAIMPVHLYGQLCDMKRLRAIADARGLEIIADSAHAVEARRQGVGSAQLVEASCYSFYATKNLACGEGGAVATPSPELAQRLKRLRLHGMSRGAADRYHGRFQHYDMLELGRKANLSDLLASLLLPQLPRLEERLQRREAICRRYAQALTGLPGLELLEDPPHSRSARHLFTILVPRRDRFLQELQAEGIGVAVNYRPVHLLDYYRRRLGYAPGDFPRAEDIGRRTLTLPLYPDLQDEEVELVIQAVTRVAERLAG